MVSPRSSEASDLHENFKSIKVLEHKLSMKTSSLLDLEIHTGSEVPIKTSDLLGLEVYVLKRPLSIKASSLLGVEIQARKHHLSMKALSL